VTIDEEGDRSGDDGCSRASAVIGVVAAAEINQWWRRRVVIGRRGRSLIRMILLLKEHGSSGVRLIKPAA